MLPYWERLAIHIVPVVERNPLAADFVTSCHKALGVPVHDDFNAAPFADGAGFFPVGYHPETGIRSSSSVAYLHPHLDRPNLTVRTGHLGLPAGRPPGDRVTGVRTTARA